MVENIQKAENGEDQPQDNPEQLSNTEDVISIDDILNALAEVESPKGSQQSTSRASMDDYCPFPEELAPHAFPSDWIYNA